MQLSLIKIRKANAQDCGELENLYVELTGDSSVNVLPERLEEISKDPGTRLYVCEINGMIVGTALVSLCRDVMYQNQPFAVVENVVIKRTERQKGIGTALMKEIETFCLEADCSKIMLLSSAARSEAHVFFEKSGFSGDKKRGFVKYRRYFQSKQGKTYNSSLNRDGESRAAL